jgi:predicted Zn-dependent protease
MKACVISTVGARAGLRRLNRGLLFAVVAVAPLHFASILILEARAEPAKTTAGAAQEDPVLRAMHAELDRSKSQLKMENMPAPYYVEYRVTDLDHYEAEAVFGALRFETRQHVRWLRAVVRVGDYHRDSYYGQGQGVVDILSIDDDPLALRQTIWFATDRAYKSVTEALTAKQALLKQFTTDLPVDDFAHAPVIESIGPLARLDVDPAPWRQMLVSATALFRRDPQVESLSAFMKFEAWNTYFLNSEGTATRSGHTIYQMVLNGSTQAADGMRLQRSPEFVVGSIAELPTAEKFIARTQEMLDALAKLREAPLVEEEFRGPVLFESDPASEILEDIVGENLLGQKPPPEKPGRTTGNYGASYKSRVLPEFLSVMDDPTMRAFDGHSLVGSYDVDDEGVRGERVAAVENGVLKTYLLGRAPIRDVPDSNGHGRAAPTAPPGPSVGILTLKSSQSLAPGELKKKLAEICRQQGKPYGYLVKTFGPSLTPRLLYRVWENDGHEELVRGAVFDELDTRELRNDLVAVGNDFVANNHWKAVPTTVINPSLLFDELVVKRADLSKEKLPEYPPPALSAPR